MIATLAKITATVSLSQLALQLAENSENGCKKTSFQKNKTLIPMLSNTHKLKYHP
jgi:hypothetical protein